MPNCWRRGQVTAEFLIVIIALLAVFGFSIAVYSSNSSYLSENSELSGAMVSASEIANALDSVSTAGDSSSAEFFFKSMQDLNASVGNGILTIMHQHGITEVALHSSSVDFSGFEFNKRLKFSNNSGTVVVGLAD